MCFNCQNEAEDMLLQNIANEYPHPLGHSNMPVIVGKWWDPKHWLFLQCKKLVDKYQIQACWVWFHQMLQRIEFGLESELLRLFSSAAALTHGLTISELIVGPLKFDLEKKAVWKGFTHGCCKATGKLKHHVWEDKRVLH